MKNKIISCITFLLCALIISFLVLIFIFNYNKKVTEKYSSLNINGEQIVFDMNSFFQKNKAAIQINETKTYSENQFNYIYSSLTDTVSMNILLNNDLTAKKIELKGQLTDQEDEILSFPISIIALLSVVSPELDTDEQIILLEELGLNLSNNNLLNNFKQVVKHDKLYELSINNGISFSIQPYE